MSAATKTKLSGYRKLAAFVVVVTAGIVLKAAGLFDDTISNYLQWVFAAYVGGNSIEHFSGALTKKPAPAHAPAPSAAEPVEPDSDPAAQFAEPTLVQAPQPVPPIEALRSMSPEDIQTWMKIIAAKAARKP